MRLEKSSVLIVMFLILIVPFMHCQKENIYQLPIPKNLDECFEVLDISYSDETQKMLQDLVEDSVLLFIMSSDEVNLISAWKLDQNSVLSKYFYRCGLERVDEMHEMILISYYRYLNGFPIELKDQVEYFREQRIKASQDYQAQLVADSVGGVYIPGDISDCFRVLSATLQPEEIIIIGDLPSREAIVKYIPDVCEWLMGAFLLEVPTRLQIYMVSRGVHRPIMMAVEIMRFYYDYLNEDHEAWQQFDKRK